MITIKLWLPDRQTNEETDTGQSYPRDSLLHCFALNTIFACKAKCHRYQFVHLSACVCPSVCYALLLLSPHVFCRTLVTKWTRVSSAEVLIKFDNQKVWNYSIHRWMDRHLPGKRIKLTIYLGWLSKTGKFSSTMEGMPSPLDKGVNSCSDLRLLWRSCMSPW